MQIQFGADAQPPLPDVPALHVASPRIEVPDELGDLLPTIFSTAAAAEPTKFTFAGNKLTFKGTTDIPLRLNLFGLHIDRSVPVDGDAYIQLFPTDAVPANDAASAVPVVAAASEARLSAVETLAGKLESGINSILEHLGIEKSEPAAVEAPEAAPIAEPVHEAGPVAEATPASDAALELHEAA